MNELFFIGFWTYTVLSFMVTIYCINLIIEESANRKTLFATIPGLWLPLLIWVLIKQIPDFIEKVRIAYNKKGD